MIVLVSRPLDARTKSREWQVLLLFHWHVERKKRRGTKGGGCGGAVHVGCGMVFGFGKWGEGEGVGIHLQIWIHMGVGMEYCEAWGRA